jgi:hypothetical protein
MNTVPARTSLKSAASIEVLAGLAGISQDARSNATPEDVL